MPKYRVCAYFTSRDEYTVEADSEEGAVERVQEMCNEEVPSGEMTYERDVEVECVEWDAMEEA